MALNLYSVNLNRVSRVFMNLKQVFASIGLVAGTTLAYTIAPVQAASLTPAELGLPSLSINNPVGDGRSAPLGSLPYETSAFKPSEDLKVKFSVLLPEGLGSRGMGLSSFGYISPETGGFVSIFEEGKAYNTGSRAHTNDWLGTCGIAISSLCEATITFKAGLSYQLALLSNGVSTFGVGAMDEYTFDAVSDQYYTYGKQYTPTLASKFVTVGEAGALFIGMEDGEYMRERASRTSPATYYYDYQDWVVKAEAVPEPATLAGLGVVAGGLMMARRRKSAHSA